MNGQFQGCRFTSKKGIEASLAAPRPSSAQTSYWLVPCVIFLFELYTLLHVSLSFLSFETERAAERESRSPDQRCSRHHYLQELMKRKDL